MKFKGLIVGLGQIGMGYDYDKSSSDFIFTHAKALYLHPEFELAQGVDQAPERREMFYKKYDKPVHESLEKALQDCSPELAIVATSTREHFGVFQQLLESSSLRLVLCEKPLAGSLAEAETMLDLAKEQNVSVAVNYIRRYDSGFQILLKRIRSGELGFPLKVCVWYRKGIFNSGSHILNLLSPLLGEVRRVQIISRGRRWDGWDPEPDLRLDFERGETYFLAGREEDFSYSQVEIVGPRGKMLYDKDGGISWWGMEQDPAFPGYSILQQTAEEIPTDMKRYQYNVLQNLSNFLSGHSELLCDSDSGLQTMRILNQIEEALA